MSSRRPQVSLLVWLVLVWLMLWGTVDTATIVFGVVVAVAVLLIYPPAHVRSRFFARPLRLLVLGGYLVVDLLLSALRLVWETFRWGRDIKAAIVAVPLLSDEDHVIASAANMLSLAPGRFVLQLDRAGGLCYVYALGVRSPAAADRVCDEFVDLQVRVIKTFGSADELADLPAAAARARRGAADRHGRDGNEQEGKAP